MSRSLEFLLLAAAVTSALLTIGGVLVWLVWPRLEDKLQEVMRGVSRVEDKLGDAPDSVGGHAKTAARAAAELPAIREQLATQADTLAGIGAKQADLDAWRGSTDRRLGSVEEALIALLGKELRNRIVVRDDPPETHHHHHLGRPDPT